MKKSIKKTEFKYYVKVLDKLVKAGFYDDALNACDHILNNPASYELEECAVIHAYRAKVHLLNGEGASHIAVISDLLACQELEPEAEQAEHLYTEHIRRIFSYVFKKLGKSGVLAAINCIPDKDRVIYALQQSLLRRSYFGNEFWEPKGVLACNLERGTLLTISNELKVVHTKSASEWQRLGDEHLQNKKPDYAMQAYTFALHQADNSIDKAISYFGIGNSFFAKKWRQDANKQYKKAIKCSPSFFAPHMQRIFLLADSKHPEHIRKVIQLIIKMDDRRQGYRRRINMTDHDKAIFSNCVKKMFARHGKKKIFEVIKTLNDDDKFSLLQDIVEDENKQHFLGKHFWKNRIPFTSCARNKGTLKEIDQYLQQNAPLFGLSARNSTASMDSHSYVGLNPPPRRSRPSRMIK